jgi:hypothetical protein
MSDTSAAAAAIPPGWYDDGTGSGLRRWWSGAGWTEHVESPYATGAAPRPTLPADRPIYSVWVWLIVLLPLLSYASFLLWQPNFDYLNALNYQPSTSDVASMYSSMLSSILTPGYFAIILLTWVIYGVTVVFAWRDVVWLRTQGVVRPFSWPWVFLGGLVYVIGRSVIVYRVAKPRGRAPIWVLIAVIAFGFVVSLVWSALLMSSMFSNLPGFSQYSS